MDTIKHLVIEAFGVFSLVYIGGLGVWSTTVGGSLTSVGLAHGIILGFVIVMGGPISGGQFNPAVTLALLLTGDMPALKGILYIIAQSAGSLAAAIVLAAAKPAAITSKTIELGFPILAENVTVMQGFLFEFTATFFLVLAVYTGVRTNQNEKTIALYVGGILLCFIQAIGPYTGAALNPCRTLGPAILTGQILKRGGWIYYPATLFGGVTAGFFSSLFVHSDESVKTKQKDEDGDDEKQNELSVDMTM